MGEHVDLPNEVVDLIDDGMTVRAEARDTRERVNYTPRARFLLAARAHLENERLASQLAFMDIAVDPAAFVERRVQAILDVLDDDTVARVEQRYEELVHDALSQAIERGPAMIAAAQGNRMQRRHGNGT
jgi:hypothetical protein